MASRSATRSPPWLYLTRSDEALAEAFAHGDEDALAALLRRHGDILYTVAYGILLDGEEADEAVRRTFVKLLRRPPRQSEPLRLKLLRGVVCRARRRSSLHRLGWPKRRCRRAVPLHSLGDPRTARRSLGALACLPRPEREVVILCDGLRMTYEDAARILRRSPRSVGLRLARARWRLLEVTGRESGL